MTKEELRIELEKLEVYESSKLEELMKDTLLTNEKFNLTAITKKEEFRELMILDSLYPLELVDFKNKKVIDVGTGAGYPGLPLAMVSPSSQFTLIDSTKKKIDHINEFVSLNDIQNVKGVSERVENYAKKHREEFDLAIARAVAPLNILIELIVPLLKVGGVFIAMKGVKGKEEIEASKKALKELDSEVIEIQEIELPQSKEKRINIVIKKNSVSKKKYPRDYSEICKNPL